MVARRTRRTLFRGIRRAGGFSGSIMKPPIDRADFDRLAIRAGIVTELRRLEPMNLTSVEIDAGQRFTALLTNGVARNLTVGSQVAFVSGLHALRAHDENHTAFVIAILSGEVPLTAGARVA